MQDLIQKVLSGDRRAVARAISLVENRAPERVEVMTQLASRTGKAYCLGITGSPGAGKSSLVDRLTAEYRKQGKSVGVIAVDPTSPFSGGALLGDRIRMQNHATDPGVYIRSMGTRGSLGGVSLATKETVKILDAAGFEIILVETVGVGQSELDIMKVADTTVVVLTPGAGDSIQAMKAGIMEIAHVFAVNKADLPGAKKVVNEIQATLEQVYHDASWRPPVVETVTIDGTGTGKLVEAVEKHKVYLENAGELAKVRSQRAMGEVMEMLEYEIKERVRVLMDLEARRMQVNNRDPYGTVRRIINELFPQRS